MTDKPQHEFGVSRETDTEAPSDVSRETGKKPSRKSAVYLYLLVLFGAAFLMLLLAYFIQQRNNAEAIDGLQDSWNLSREELVEEIAKLKEEKEQWQADTQAAAPPSGRNGKNAGRRKKPPGITPKLPPGTAAKSRPQTPWLIWSGSARSGTG